ncbi:papain family cysteine protease domain-containing protein [Ditylenchus destructor]|nr:papain family cysteine protease domain-containing protein [Ditylenchus destructor]
MKILLTFVIITFSIVQLVAAEPSNGKDDEKRAKAKHDVDEINQKNHGLWRAEVNDRFALMEPEQKKKLAGSFTRRKNGNPNPPKNEQPNSEQSSDPQHFDSRTKWSQCAPIIGNIRDQSNCGSCWAVSTGSVLTDRKCIAKVKTGQAVNPNSPSSWASEADVMTCSGGSADGDGCNGGWPFKAFNSMVTKGVLSGTNYTWNAGCKPYPFSSTGGPYSAIGCSSTCKTGSNDYSRTYMSSSTSLYDGSSTYAQQMMQEIYNNGPVVATMDVYEDFYYYASGVYSYTYGAFQGGHAVRIIGWGSLNGVNYWLAANSWGKNWGQQGLFMIRRGVNEVYIESEISYGAVKL